MVAMFFVVQVVNNYALNFNISIPLHTIFRAVSRKSHKMFPIFNKYEANPLDSFIERNENKIHFNNKSMLCNIHCEKSQS